MKIIYENLIFIVNNCRRKQREMAIDFNFLRFPLNARSWTPEASCLIPIKNKQEDNSY